MIEQVWITDKIYIGDVETMTKEIFEKHIADMYQAGIRLVEEIESEE